MIVFKNNCNIINIAFNNLLTFYDANSSKMTFSQALK